MRRREFITLVGGAAAAWPVVARAQQVAKVARIGWMSRGNATANDPNMNAFRQGMRELGYVEGQSFLLEPRFADGKIELMPDQAAELERAGVDLIVAGPFDALLAARQRTSRVPIIMTPAADPVVTGIVESLDHPGGNITGITEMMPELTPQRLKLLTQIVPNISRVAIMWRPGTLNPSVFDQMLNDTQAATRSIGVQLQIVEAAKVDDFDSAFATIARERAEGLIVLVNPMYVVAQKQIIERAANNKLPAIYEWKVFVQNGGLISHGADVPDVYRRAAGIADTILKGKKPAELAVMRPTKLGTAINLKTAKALNLTVPPGLLATADEVIE
jgi:putative tryptophan/tyrosine transport system substrate-binding protein